MSTAELNVILLHDQMENKEGRLVTTSLTLIDIHDLARSARTYGVKTLFIAHPSAALRKLARTLHAHWDEGFGATYNPNRKDALGIVEIVGDLDEAIHKIDLRSGTLPRLIATSAKGGDKRITFAGMKGELQKEGAPLMLMLGTGWGMTDSLLNRATYFLEPVRGPTEYNHLSVRSACAIMLDRLVGLR